MKIYILITFFLTVSACSTREQLPKLSDMKKKDRVYTGIVNVRFNDKQNEETKCDFFLSSSLSPEFKVPKDGFIVFLTDDRKVQLSQIACPYRTGNQSFWVYHDIELEPIAKPIEKDHVSYFGNLEINWQITDSDIFNAQEKLKNSTLSKVENKGKFQVIVKSEVDEHTQMARQKIKELQTNERLKVIENTFKVDAETEAEQTRDDY